MTWAAPLWLLGLIPWSAVVLYLIWGRRPRVDVPFLDLWPAQGEGVRVRRRVTPPPIALALAILAMLFAILAAGRPGIRRGGGESTFTLILDRGYTMSARGSREDVTRLVETLEKCPIQDSAERVVVPPGNFDAPTAVDTRDAVRVAVRAALARDAGPVTVITDQPLGIDDPRVIEISPENTVKNTRIVMLAARETPVAQVMVRVRGGAGFKTAKIRVASGDQRVERDISISSDSDHDEFFDFAKLGPTIRADLVIDDDQPADNSAWLVRESSWPRIESRIPLPAHLQRMVDVYAQQRPAGDASRKIIVTASLAEVPPDGPAILLPPIAGSVSTTRPSVPEVVDHLVTHGVNWTEIGTPAVASDPPPSGWTPVVSVGGKALIAVRDQPARAVWVGFDTREWAKSSDFVVFWANVFNWAGTGDERFASYPVGSLEGDWTPVEMANSASKPEPMLWPGVYRRSDGTLRALHAPDMPIPTSVETHWRARLAELQARSDVQLELAPWFVLLAVGCLGGWAILWKSRRAPALTPEKAAT